MKSCLTHDQFHQIQDIKGRDSIQEKRQLIPAHKQSTKGNVINLEKLINDIKIFPKENSTYYINIILSNLKLLLKHQVIIDEIQTIILLMQSIEKKLYSSYLIENRINMVSKQEKLRNDKTVKAQHRQLKMSSLEILQNLKVGKLRAQIQTIQYQKISLQECHKTFPQQSGSIALQNTGKQNKRDHLNSKQITKKDIQPLAKLPVDCEIDQLSREIRDLDQLLYGPNGNK